MIMATGPLTGTMASTGGRYSIITKSPLTVPIACSNSGGFIGAEIKNAGWDMIIFEGRAPRPVYLYLENDRAELIGADELWGRSVWIPTKNCTEGIKIRYCAWRLSVGQLSKAVCMRRDQRFAPCRWPFRCRNRNGVQKLKAVAVRGTKGVGNIKDPIVFMKATADGKKVLADNAVTGEGLPKYGTQVLDERY